MPWCPQCGAEYREGIVVCARCGVGLVGERPPSAAPRPAAQAVVRKVWADAKRAWGYLAGAARLLRRNPSLLLLPLAVVLFNTVEGTAGGYIMVTRTAYGRALQERARNRPAPKPPPWPVVRVVRFRYDLATPAIPSVTLRGTSAVAGTALLGAGGAGEVASLRSEALTWLCSLLIALLMIGPLNALLRGGYYGVVAGTIASGKANWRGFGLHARRFFARFWRLYAVFLIVISLLFWVEKLASRGPMLVGGWWVAWFWAYRLVGFLLALAALVIVAGDCGVLTGIHRTLLTVVRDIAVAVVLAVGIGAVGWVVAYGFGWLRGWAWTLNPTSDLTQVHWPRVGVDLGQDSILALLSVVFVLAALIWYREASAKLWPARAAEAAGTADERG
jgi:hypothetical protein